MAAITNLWPSDQLVIEQEPLKTIKMAMNYTRHKRLDLWLIYPSPEDDPDNLYPNCSLVVKIKSKVMPPDLVEKMLKMSEKTVKKLAATEGGGKPQALAVFDFVRKIMENNNLIPVWSELQEI